MALQSDRADKKPELKEKAYPPPYKGINKDMPAHLIPLEYMVVGTNVRCQRGAASKFKGFEPLTTNKLEAKVNLIEQFYDIAGNDRLILGCTTEIYRYNPAVSPGTLIPITRYDAGQITLVNADETVTGAGTSFTNYIKAGDTLIDVDGTTEAYVVDEVTDDTHLELTAVWAKANVGPVDYEMRQILDNTGFWSTDIYLDKLYIAGGGNQPLYRWDVSYDYLEIVLTQTLSPMTTACYLYYFYVASFENHLVLTKLSTHPIQYAWCDLGDPDNWSTGEAGTSVFSEGVDELVGMLGLRDSLITYRERKAHALEYRGGALVWNVETPLRGIGPVSGRAFLSMGDYHYLVGPDSFYGFDGRTPDYIGIGVIQDYLKSNIHPGGIGEVICFIIEEDNHIYIAYPSTATDGSYCDYCLVYDYIDHIFMERELPNINSFGFYYEYDTKYIDDYEDIIDDMDILIDSALLLQLAPVNLVGNKDGEVLKVSKSYLNLKDTAGAETAITTSIESGEDTFGNPKMMKQLVEANIKMSGSDLSLYIGSKNNFDDAFSWSGPYTITATQPWAKLRKSGKIFKYKIECSGLGTYFDYKSLIVKYFDQGER